MTAAKQQENQLRTTGVIEVRGARVHSLKDVDVDVPLGQLVGIAGVSGSGKSSLAMGVLYAEGSRRYIEALSTYTRRRMAQAARAQVDSVRHVPAALALRQRPGVPGVRSTFGTSTELLNVLRVMFSRLGSHLCPNGHRLPPTIDVAANLNLTCPVCEAVFYPPGAESFAFNSDGACPTCTGTGTVREIDDSTLIPDPTKTIEQGAVAPWSMFGLSVMPQVVAEFDVRTDIPYADLTDVERETVLHGPPEQRHIAVRSKNGKLFELDFTYRNARLAVQEALDNATSEKGLSRVNKFITAQVCPSCQGSRLSEMASGTQVAGQNLAQATRMTLGESVAWVRTITAGLPPEMHSMARMIIEQYQGLAARLTQLGLNYLTLDRASGTLSTGELQRVQLSRAVRNQTTGVLYVLDEPSIGLHAANVEGLVGVIRDLLEDGNSVVLVDHDVQVLREADWVIEMGPGSGASGGEVVASGTIDSLTQNPASLIAGFITGSEPVLVRERARTAVLFERGAIALTTSAIHTVHALDIKIPMGRLTAVTGVSGSGKTTLVLDSLVPALRAAQGSGNMPTHVSGLDAPGIVRVDVVDAIPIGTNVRSTIATYTGILDELRRSFAATESATRHGLKAADFSYNTGSLRCPRCEGTGQITLDVQFLPDVDIPCPDCDGRRYSAEIEKFRISTADGAEISLAAVLALTATEADELLGHMPKVRRKLRTLIDLGLGYLTLGEDTPALSGGEAQRLKLATELSRNQSDSVFVFDEPSVGLHPLDTRVLISVLDKLLTNGATVIVIDHDLDLIANADYILDLGPGGGADGGRLIAAGTPASVAASEISLTGKYLNRILGESVRPS